MENINEEGAASPAKMTFVDVRFHCIGEGKQWRKARALVNRVPLRGLGDAVQALVNKARLLASMHQKKQPEKKKALAYQHP